MSETTTTETELSQSLRITREAWLRARVYVAAHPELTIGGLASEAIHKYVAECEGQRSTVACSTSQG